MSDPKQVTSQSSHSLVKSGEAVEKALLIERATFDRKQISQKTVIQCRVEDSYFKEADFRRCNFLHTRFVRCYFRGASFSNSTFQGCFFDSCNFDGAKFHDCRLEYSEFVQTQIKYAQISGCLPHWPNVLLRLARSLRKNAESLGDSEEYRRFLSLELSASQQHNWDVLTKFDNYYEKYKVIDRIRALRNCVVDTIERLVWGYGEKWSRVLWTGAIVSLLYALALRFSNAQVNNIPDGATIWTYLSLSIGNLLATDYHSAYPANTLAWALLLSERAIGFVIFGFLVTSLYVRISKR